MIKHATAMKIMALHDMGTLSLSTLTSVLEEIRNQVLEDAAAKMTDQPTADSGAAAKYADAIRAMKSF
jgi:hypothetical protein